MLFQKFVQLNFFLIMVSFTSMSQSIEIKGVVMDKEGFFLEGATVILTNKTLDKKKYTITDILGEFNFIADEDMLYVKVTYIGYETENITINDTTKKIIITLNKSIESLDEIKLDYKPAPIVIKKDTVTIDVLQFLDGNERKMIDVLEKLPGISIAGDKILVQGKEIKKVLVEGDAFFHGNTNFAVENIPADVINKIEITDNYNEVGFLTRVTDSDDTVINVKLKKDKKSFYFGEIGLGYGNDNFFEVNGDYINYSKQTELAIVSASNNTSNPLNNIVNLLANETSIENPQLTEKLFDFRFQNKFYKENIQSGLGISFKNKINENSSLIITTLFKNQNDEKDKSALREYLNPEIDLFEESRERSQNNLNDFFLNTSYSYNISDNEKIFVNSSLTKTMTANHSFFNSITESSVLEINNEGKFENFIFNNQISHFKKFSDKLTTTFSLSYFGDMESDIDSFHSNESLFPDYFNDPTFHQLTKNESTLTKMYGALFYSASKRIIFDFKFNISNHNGSANLKLSSPTSDYVLSNKTHLKIGNYFASAGVLFSRNLLKSYASVSVGQINTAKNSSNYISPLIKVSYKKSLEKEVSFKYEYVVKPVSLYQLKDFNYIKDFNTLSIGNPNLEPIKYHLLNFNYFYSNFSSGFTFYGNAEYLNYDKSLLIENSFVNQKNQESLRTTNLDRYEGNVQIVIGKVYHKFKLSLSPQINLSKFPQIVENVNIESKNSKVRLKLMGESLFKNSPNVRLSFTQTYNKFESELANRKFDLSNFSLGLFKKNKQLEYSINYAYHTASNKFFKDFHQLFFKADYNFKNSAWAIFLQADNLLDQSEYSSNFITDVAITEERVARISRNIILGISYKF